MTNSVTNQYTFEGLPRDGKTLFLHEGSLPDFLEMASKAAYILIPRPYWPMVAKWVEKTQRIKLAEMSEDNRAGGFMGTAADTDMFSDAYAPKQSEYPAGCPVLFGQFTGQFIHALETERCPYFRMRCYEKHSLRGSRPSGRWKPDAGATVEQLMLKAGRHLRNVQSITVPSRYYEEFSKSLHELAPDVFLPETFPIAWGNGFVGVWNGIHIYTDHYLHPALINPIHEFGFHAVAYTYDNLGSLQAITGKFVAPILQVIEE